jgi:hypothetical protein
MSAGIPGSGRLGLGLVEPGLATSFELELAAAAPAPSDRQVGALFDLSSRQTTRDGRGYGTVSSNATAKFG